MQIPNKPGNLKAKFIRFRTTTLIIGLLAIYLIGYGVSAYGVYWQGWYRKEASFASKVFPMPLMFINFRPVFYSHYHKRSLDFDIRELEANRDPGYFKTQEGKEELASVQRRLLEVILTEEFIKQYSSVHKVSVSKEYVQEQYDKLVSENGGRVAFERSLTESYHWSPAYFRKILELELLKERINTEYCDKEIPDSKAVAEDILSQTKQPKADFAALARKYSEDPVTAANGGLLGTVDLQKQTLKDSSDEVDSKLVQYLERAETGSVELIKTCEGYVIVRVDDKSKTEATARIILIRTLGFTELEQEFRQKSSIKIFAKGFSYDHGSGSIQST